VLRRISVLLLSAVVMVALVPNAALAAPPDNKGACDNDANPDCAEEDKVTGPAADPNAWGSVVSQTAMQSEGTFGQHASNPPGGQPRDGLGNVARNDAGDEGPNAPDTGDHVGDHACIADNPFGANCTAEPGNSPDRPDS
jgi:hypothetical protein